MGVFDVFKKKGKEQPATTVAPSVVEPAPVESTTAIPEEIPTVQLTSLPAEEPTQVIPTVSAEAAPIVPETPVAPVTPIVPEAPVEEPVMTAEDEALLQQHNIDPKNPIIILITINSYIL